LHLPAGSGAAESIAGNQRLNTRTLFLLIAMSLAGCSSATVTPSGRVDLQAACFLTAGASSPRLKFTISNGTAQHLSIPLGYIRWEDEQCLSALSLRLKRSGRHDEEPLVSMQPGCGPIAGRADPWRLEMMPGGRTTLQFDGTHFMSQRSWTRLSLEDRGQLKVVLRSGGGRKGNYAPVPAWTGLAESNWVRFPEDCASGG
jgi:hypothetical protein